MFDLVERLRETVGPSMTVWGVKWAGGKIGWEYYLNLANVFWDRKM
jgi:hypothetical protein